MIYIFHLCLSKLLHAKSCLSRNLNGFAVTFKGTVSPDYLCPEGVRFNRPGLGHETLENCSPEGRLVLRLRSFFLFDLVADLAVHYHSGGSMKLNACNLLLTHMVYL